MLIKYLDTRASLRPPASSTQTVLVYSGLSTLRTISHMWVAMELLGPSPSRTKVAKRVPREDEGELRRSSNSSREYMVWKTRPVPAAPVGGSPGKTMGLVAFPGRART